MPQDFSPVLAAYVTGNERDSNGIGWTEVAKPLGDRAERHGGTVIALPGDGWFLATFTNALEALKCAIDIQQRSLAGTAEDAPIRTPRCHLGLNHETTPVDNMSWPPGRDDSVDRLVALSEPGGICLSRTVYDEVRYRVDLPFDTERDPNHTAYQCQEIRRKLDTLNLLEAGSVRISASNLAAYFTGSGVGDNRMANRSGIFGMVRAFVGRRA